ncbi:jg6785 [Pararge aegeria aegeria]|uniref:Jg6785 protein n=1 Tax=Pararge aegeria aegeria TaxID=348720 RepID=A0A8S4RQ39_9NEOP|nr:jg6785 [Pararge aegeria aegeria]
MIVVFTTYSKKNTTVSAVNLSMRSRVPGIEQKKESNRKRQFIISDFSLVWWEALGVAGYHPTDKDVPLSDVEFRCDVAEKPIRGMTAILPNRLARYHLRLQLHLAPGEIAVKG